MKRRSAITLATFFGTGYWPWGPGTAGSLAALLIAYWVHRQYHWGRVELLFVCLLLLLPSIWAAGETARQVHREDPGIVVVDEVLGQWLTLAGATALNTSSLIAGFALFRLFDIWKPFPVRHFEKLPGGTGIIADDLMAGLYGAVILYTGGILRLY